MTTEKLFSKKIAIYSIIYTLLILILQWSGQYIFYSIHDGYSKPAIWLVQISKLSIFFVLIYFIIYAILKTFRRNLLYKIATTIVLLLWFIFVPIITFGSYYGLGVGIGGGMRRGNISALSFYFIIDLFFFVLLPVVALTSDFIYTKFYAKNTSKS
ncbi:MAG: hypothetical protein WCK98_06265 [bacterium]